MPCDTDNKSFMERYDAKSSKAYASDSTYITDDVGKAIEDIEEIDF